MNLFTSSPLWPAKGLGMVRICVGALLMYHGWEVFDSEIMKSYTEWDSFKGSATQLMPYIGKSAEFLSGLLLLLGVATRLAALMTMGTFLYITFFIGHGKFWYEDQHPFMFFLFGIAFFCSGPGAWSVDNLVFKNRGKGELHNPKA